MARGRISVDRYGSRHHYPQQPPERDPSKFYRVDFDTVKDAEAAASIIVGSSLVSFVEGRRSISTNASPEMIEAAMRREGVRGRISPMAQAPVISEATAVEAPAVDRSSSAPTIPASGTRRQAPPVSDYEGQVRGVLIQLGSADPDGDINATRKFLEGCQDAQIDPAVCAANIYTSVKHKHGGGTILREAGAAEEASEAGGRWYFKVSFIDGETLTYGPYSSKAEAQKKRAEIAEDFRQYRVNGTIGDFYRNEGAAEMAPVISEQRSLKWTVEVSGRRSGTVKAKSNTEALAKAERRHPRAKSVLVYTHPSAKFGKGGKPVVLGEPAAPATCAACIPWVKVTRDPAKHAEHMELAAKHGVVKTPKQVYALVGHSLMKDKAEVFILIPLNVRSELCCPPYEIARGQTSKVHVEAVDVIRAALDSGCESFIVAHNHPTGKCHPSRADRVLTNNIKKATAIYGKSLCMIDHVVIGNGQAYSIFEDRLYKI